MNAERRIAAEMQARGDTDGADVWLRATVAIEELGHGPGDRRVL